MARYSYLEEINYQNKVFIQEMERNRVEIIEAETQKYLDKSLKTANRMRQELRQAKIRNGRYNGGKA